MAPTTATLRSLATPVLRAYGVVRAGVFGSYARGQATDASDVDLIVEFEAGRSLLDLVALQRSLVEALGFHVDVATYKSLHPLLREQILAEEQRLL